MPHTNTQIYNPNIIHYTIRFTLEMRCTHKRREDPLARRLEPRFIVYGGLAQCTRDAHDTYSVCLCVCVRVLPEFCEYECVYKRNRLMFDPQKDGILHTHTHT